MLSVIKKNASILLLIFFFSSVSFAQENADFVKSKFKGNVSTSKYFGKRLKYPLKSLKRDKKGRVVIDFRINNKGIIDSIFLVSFFDKELADNAIKLLIEKRRMWTPTLINRNPSDFVYKMVVNCNIFKSELPKKSEVQRVCERSRGLREKKKLKKALKILNSAIRKKPFEVDLLKERGIVLNALDEKEKANKDILLMKQILISVDLIAVYKLSSVTVF